jgi:adenylate kinase family enzyme
VPERDPAVPLTERRILVYGVTGSGKSTAAARIAATTGLPLHLADELTWMPGWVPVDDDVQRERFAEIVATDAWVLDTAYAAWRDLVLARSELVVGLDYPRWRSLARLVRRTVVRLVDRRPICNGNVETVGTLLSRDSIVVWHFSSFARKRDRMRAWAASDDVPILLFRRPAELERWLASLERAGGRSTPAAPTRGPVR